MYTTWGSREAAKDAGQRADAAAKNAEAATVAAQQSAAAVERGAQADKRLTDLYAAQIPSPAAHFVLAHDRKINYRLVNDGTTTAYEVHLDDFAKVGGLHNSTDWTTIDAGATNESASSTPWGPSTT